MGSKERKCSSCGGNIRYRIRCDGEWPVEVPIPPGPSRVSGQWLMDRDRVFVPLVGCYCVSSLTALRFNIHDLPQKSSPTPFVAVAVRIWLLAPTIPPPELEKNTLLESPLSGEGA
ncbi:uncharacterized protein TrAFT101_003549 [Trichoderma asperellum]|uniref:uncharacterized protein n=1 Tax=Trichoderma asperellum TaxID=101201 RepID=UPI00332346DA|nr:hypothetical protein TrAFT101_003549 [Trichoderma asperellum]